MIKKNVMRKSGLAAAAAAVLAVSAGGMGVFTASAGSMGLFTANAGGMTVWAEETSVTAQTLGERTEAGVLTELGTIEDESKDLSIWGSITKKVDDETSLMYTELGEAVEGSEHLQAGALDREQQYIILTKKGELAASSALYSADGTELIPFGAAVIKMVYGSDRYVQVSYIEEETEQEEEAIVYSTDNRFSLFPKEGDQLFKGYWQIYDLKNKKFVENIKFTSTRAEVKAADGDTFLVSGDDGSKKVYDCNGMVLCEDAGNVTFSNQFYFENVSSGVICYDSSYSRLFETNDTINAIGDRNDCLQYYKDGVYGLIDTSGTIILETGFDSMINGKRDSDAFMVAEDVNDDFNFMHGLMRADGTLLADCQYNNISYCGNGYYYGTTKLDDGYRYTILGEDSGVIFENAENFDSAHVTAYQKKEESCVYYVMNDRDYTLELGNSTPIDFCLVKAKDENGMWGLFETMTGAQVLDYAYMDIQMAYGKIYAYKDGAYTVYEWA